MQRNDAGDYGIPPLLIVLYSECLEQVTKNMQRTVFLPAINEIQWLCKLG